MFVTALGNGDAVEYFRDYYGIDFDRPAIQTDSLDSILSPLLLVQYISVLEKLVKRGLKKDFVFREENLSSKIRGKILVQTNMRTNVFKNRLDKIYCRFQEYTVDTKENRLLKKLSCFQRRWSSPLTLRTSRIGVYLN